MRYMIRAASLSGFEELVRNFDVNPLTILEEVGLQACQLRYPDEYISYDSCASALELASIRCQCPYFGLKLSLNQGLKTLGIVGAYMSRQISIKKALEIAKRYAYVHSEGVIINIVELSSEQCEIRYDVLHGSNLRYPQKALLSLSVINNLMSEMIGPSWEVQKLCLKQSENKENKEHIERAFRCQTEFDAVFDSLHFHPSHLLKKPVVSETLIDQIIHQQFDLQTNQKQPNLVALVEHTIKMLLVTGECTKESTALCINIHSKKLQRLLKSENTSYQNILDTVRKKEATRQLRNLSINLTEVALNLGFSEFSVFSRKFKNWFGIAPSLWRKKEASNAILGS